MMVNAGLAIELGLKLIHHKLNSSAAAKSLRTHSLAELYGLFDKGIQADLDTAYKATIQEWDAGECKTIARALTTRAPAPDGPAYVVGPSFHDMLVHLDDATLFLRRYSFEEYSLGKWWVEFEADFLIMIYNALGRYADSIPA